MFDSGDIVWMDFESAGARDLKAAGTIGYATDAATRAIVLAYAIGNAPARAWHADGAILDWEDAPDDLCSAFDRGAIIAAWNASFDSAVWNYATLKFPFLVPERVIDVMVQAGVSNLPTDLERASRALGGAGKQKDGKKLIKLFSIEAAAPRAHLAEWQQFLAYARQDVEAMRDVYRQTRPLPLAEWREYWAFERINRRGVTIDVPFVTRAAALAAEDAGAIGRRLVELTDGAVTRVTQAKRIATWLHDLLPDAAMREVLMVGGAIDADDEDEDEAADLEFSLTRDRVARVLAMLEAKQANGGLNAAEMRAHEAATLRLYGAGASPKKFVRLTAQQVDGELRDQYRFAGAGQTGRLSSRGAQIQNLTRDVINEHGGDEAALVDMIADGGSYAALAAANPIDMPVARKLALIVRPALVAAPKKLFVWSDWSTLEARVNPWLAASPDAERVLDTFRANDADPSLPDNYMIAAADVLHKNEPSGITKTERWMGKVVILACGFGGSIGALKAMALSYHINLDNAEARRIIDAWRSANSWAPRVLGRAPRRRELWLVGRRHERLGNTRPDHHSRADRLRLPRRLPRRRTVHGVAIRAPAHLSAAKVARRRQTRQRRKTNRRETQRTVVSARARTRKALARHPAGERGSGHCRRPPAHNRNTNRNQPGARVHAHPHDDA